MNVEFKKNNLLIDWPITFKGNDIGDKNTKSKGKTNTIIYLKTPNWEEKEN